MKHNFTTKSFGFKAVVKKSALYTMAATSLSLLIPAVAFAATAITYTYDGKPLKTHLPAPLGDATLCASISYQINGSTIDPNTYVPKAGTYTLTATCLPKDTDVYDPQADTLTLTVNAATPTPTPTPTPTTTPKPTTTPTPTPTTTPKPTTTTTPTPTTTPAPTPTTQKYISSNTTPAIPKSTSKKNVTPTTTTPAPAPKPAPNSVPIQINDLLLDTVDKTSVIITWKTNVPTTSVVKYGATEAYGFTVNEDTATTDHKVAIKSNLSAGTTYYSQVTASDGKGGTADSSSFQFRTTGYTVNITLIDKKGKVIPGAIVRLADIEISTNEAGIASYTGTPSGEQTVSYDINGFKGEDKIRISDSSDEPQNFSVKASYIGSSTKTSSAKTGTIALIMVLTLLICGGLIFGAIWFMRRRQKEQDSEATDTEEFFNEYAQYPQQNIDQPQQYPPQQQSQYPQYPPQYQQGQDYLQQYPEQQNNDSDQK